MRFVIIAMLLVATPAGAGQPYSQSLAQCAALMDLSNRRAPNRRSGENGMRMTAARDTFYAAAVAQAQAEIDDLNRTLPAAEGINITITIIYKIF